MIKNIVSGLVFTLCVFGVVYMLTITADAEYEVQQEKERIYFERVEEMRR